MHRTHRQTSQLTFGKIKAYSWSFSPFWMEQVSQESGPSPSVLRKYIVLLVTGRQATVCARLSIVPERLINQPWPDKMASHNMKDNFLYLARVANCGLLSYIKQSSIGNVPTETITTLVALISPRRAHCTNTARKAVYTQAKSYFKPDGGFYYVRCGTSDAAWTSWQQTECFLCCCVLPTCVHFDSASTLSPDIPPPLLFALLMKRTRQPAVIKRKPAAIVPANLPRRAAFNYGME